MEQRLKKNIIELTRVTCAGYREMEKLPLLLLCDNVRSMQNVGSMLRTADAFLLSGVVMCGITGCPPHPEISKTALGAEKSVKWRHADNAAEECRRLRAEGWKICVLEQTHGSVPLNEFRPLPGEKYVIVAGNEVQGVDQEIVDMSDVALEIPQCGVKHSLNVSVSAAIALWHFFIPLRSFMEQK